jgi:hypothetical protein
MFHFMRLPLDTTRHRRVPAIQRRDTYHNHESSFRNSALLREVWEIVELLSSPIELF